MSQSNVVKRKDGPIQDGAREKRWRVEEPGSIQDVLFLEVVTERFACVVYANELVLCNLRDRKVLLTKTIRSEFPIWTVGSNNSNGIYVIYQDQKWMDEYTFHLSDYNPRTALHGLREERQRYDLGDIMMRNGGYVPNFSQQLHTFLKDHEGDILVPHIRLLPDSKDRYKKYLFCVRLHILL